MTRATPRIPEPPRPVRWRPCLAHRWVLAVQGLTMTGLGIIFYGLAFARAEGGPLFADTKLDSGAATTTGEITKVHAHGAGQGRIEFRFTTPDRRDYRGESFTDTAIRFRPGQSHDIEYWAKKPQINRVAGTEALHLDPALALAANLLLGLGLVGTAFWFRGVIRLRIAMREGRLTEAQLIELKPRLHINPSQLRVCYRFRTGKNQDGKNQDTEGQEIVHSHWVRLRSEFGQTLLDTQPRHLPVIHDKSNPRLSRAVSAHDFDPEEGA